MKFELPTFTQAKINSANVRSEKHGPDELVPAVDPSITIEQPNSVLSEFDGFLLSALYFKSEAAADDKWIPFTDQRAFNNAYLWGKPQP